MINVLALKAALVKNGFSQKAFAERLGITPKTFSAKLKAGVFGTDEVEVMIKELHISDPISIFFAPKVSCEDTESGGYGKEPEMPIGIRRAIEYHANKRQD